MINLSIISNFYIGIEPVYHKFCARGYIVEDKLEKSGFPLIHRSSSQLPTMGFDRI